MPSHGSDSISFSLERASGLLLLISSKRTARNPNYKFFKALYAPVQVLLRISLNSIIRGTERKSSGSFLLLSFGRTSSVSREECRAEIGKMRRRQGDKKAPNAGAAAAVALMNEIFNKRSHTAVSGWQAKNSALAQHN
jgi:sulfate adenylyltransferase subunit 1 (EFTu-like GTPase family)